MSPVEARHEAQAAEALPVPGHHPDQAATAVQARRRYLQQAGGGLVAALLGSVTWPAELRTRGSRLFLVVGTVADGDRPTDEAPASVRVEYGGDDQEDLAAKLTKGVQIYAEGRLTLNNWIGKDGVERSGLNITASHIEILGAHA